MPWTDFPILEQRLFERVSEYIPQDAEHFSSIQYLTELGQDIRDRPLASEKDLEVYQRLAVERPTTHIISRLQQIEKARQEFNLGSGIIFETMPTPSVIATKKSSKVCRSSASSKGLDSRSNPKPKRRLDLRVEGSKWHTKPVYGCGIQTVPQAVGLQFAN